MGMTGVYFIANEEMIDKVLENSDIIFDKKYDDYYFDIDKTWEVIDFIMKNKFDEYDILEYTVISKGCLLNNDDRPIDMGYTPILLIDDFLVKKIYNIIKDIDMKIFKSKYNFKELKKNKIYPITSHDESEDFFEYIWINFEKVKEVYKLACERNSNILFFVW